MLLTLEFWESAQLWVQWNSRILFTWHSWSLLWIYAFFFPIHHPNLISQGKKSITLCIACQLVYSLLVCLLQPFILWTAHCSCYVGSNIYSNWALHYALVAMVMICCENVTVGGQCYTRCCWLNMRMTIHCYYSSHPSVLSCFLSSLGWGFLFTKSPLPWMEGP